MNHGMHNVVSEPRPQLEAHRDQQAREMRAALQELYLLLEAYAPVWYTREHHDRALRALLQPDP